MTEGADEPGVPPEDECDVVEQVDEILSRAGWRDGYPPQRPEQAGEEESK